MLVKYLNNVKSKNECLAANWIDKTIRLLIYYLDSIFCCLIGISPKMIQNFSRIKCDKENQMNDPFVKAALASLLFSIWPILMNRSGLNANPVEPGS